MSATSTPELPADRMTIRRLRDGDEWGPALVAFDELWREMRAVQPELVEVPMGGLLVRGHHARFVHGAPEDGPASFMGRDKLEFDLSRPEDFEKFFAKANVLGEFIWAEGDWWEHTLEVLEELALILRGC
ncbi:uncharacterized protein BO95DRAFT_468606 [Aspergillus brunneoviolaceus CBS 621.78]|uniref:Uncharacterized protein n=1 Tax=Aspergillus brunneoviolaceus CBS 621.78 TaxID=1450534 RepID=A0ACD1FUK0_9EURO|nr:hypothetical protein BO95DRAFT_468606 [Aspergillus brunneoviolaceus CBS 621.78]RAH40606.1 hypothetical protein BO95DRAFT_468606 [Aspergillus brunneoviolaceus CBS 621.78]